MTLRREPATLWIGLVAPIVQGLVALLFVDDIQTQGIINAAAVAIAGAITAFLVRSDNLLPAITGAMQAVIAVALAFGLQWSPETQASIMVALGAIAAFLVRDRVNAPVAAPTVSV
jgi:hypothetical protein